MDLMDLTIVNVALPTLGQKFHTGESTLEWVVTGYLLSLAIWIPASGWIGDRFGTKKTFLFALFDVHARLGALRPLLEHRQLIIFRVLQGVGGGMMTPVGTAMLFRAFPPQERARASLILTVPTVIAPAIGPIIGGYLIDYVDWRWIFYVNVPMGIAGFIFCVLYLQEHTEELAGALRPRRLRAVRRRAGARAVRALTRPDRWLELRTGADRPASAVSPASPSSSSSSCA